MKILTFGTDSSALSYDSALAKRAVEYGLMLDKYVIVVPSKKDSEIDLSRNVKVYGCGAKLKPLALLKIYLKGRRILKSEKFDVVSVQDAYYLGFVAGLLARKFKLGLELQIHGFENFSGWRKKISQHLILKSSSIRTVSQRLKNLLIKKMGANENKIIVAPIFVATNPHPAPRHHEGEKFIFLTVGRLVPIKNIGMQIEAMTEVIKNYPSAQLWIIGDGPERNNLELIVKNLKLQADVKFFGWQKDLNEFYNQAGAFLLTSDFEGWGMSVIEAAGFCLPIIMTDVGCAGEVIENNKSGLIIPVGDKNKLAKAMTELIKNNDLRTRLAEGARQAALNLPTKNQILDLYKKSWVLAANRRQNHAN